jgi:hypothetical protein
MTQIQRETFHGMTPEEVLHNYTEWCRSNPGIEIVREHGIEPKDQSTGPGRSKPNAYSMIVEFKKQ